MRLIRRAARNLECSTRINVREISPSMMLRSEKIINRVQPQRTEADVSFLEDDSFSADRFRHDESDLPSENRAGSRNR